MARRPFASLLLVVGCGLLLALALLIVAYPRPLQGAIMRCTQAGGLCLQILMAGRAAGSPFLLATLAGLLGWSGTHGWRAGRRQVRATRAMLGRVGAAGTHPPGPRLAALCAELGLTGRVGILARAAPLALCHGLLRPRIWISHGTLALLTPPELTAVLRHERAHLRRRDPLRLLLARSLAAGVPFLPVVGELAALLPLAQELAADRAVLREQGRDDLARALLALTERHDGMATIPLATGMVGSLDARFDQLTGVVVVAPPLSRGAMLGTVLAFTAGLGVLALSLLALESAANPVSMDMQSSGPVQLPWRCLIVLLVTVGAWQVLVARGAVALVRHRL